MAQFTDDFQDLILACAIEHPEDFVCFGPIINSKHYVGVQATISARVISDYYEQNGTFPSWTIFEQGVVRRAGKVGIADDEQSKAQEYVAKIRKLVGTDVRCPADIKHVAGQVVEFCRYQAMLAAIKKNIERLKEGKSLDLAVCESAMQIGQDLHNMGVLLSGSDPDLAMDVIDRVTKRGYGVRTGYSFLDNIWKNGWAPGWLIVPLAPPKRFKCLGKGTPVLMFDGSTRPVEEIVVGDQLMGDDSQPRTVQTCGKGYGPLYRVKQKYGDDFVCNDAHILCLKHESGEILETTVEDFHKTCERVGHNDRKWQGYKTSVDFPSKPVPIDPYFVGIWLCDGSRYGPSVTVGDADPEILEYLKVYAGSLGLHTTTTPGKGCMDINLVGSQGKNNPLTEYLKGLNLIQNKHVPEVYLRNSVHVRRQILAGLIDSDGTQMSTRGFCFVSSNEGLAESVAWISRSLGLMVKVGKYKSRIESIDYTGMVWHVRIRGNVSQIPVLLPRKKSEDNRKHKGSRYKIKADQLGCGDYYGFTIDGNGRFILGDFTVTHNTTFCINLALNIAGPSIGEDVLYYTCEISDDLAAVRAMCNVSRVPMDVMYESPEKFKIQVRDQMKMLLHGEVLVKGYASKTATIADLKAHAKMAIQQGLRPKAIIIDYADTVKPSSTHKEKKDHLLQADVYTEARAMGAELGCCVIMPDRCTRDTVSLPVPSMQSFQGAFEKAGIVDIAIGLCATEAELKNNVIRLFVFLNRHGPALQHFQGAVDAAAYRMEILKELEYDPDDTGTDSKGKGKGKDKKGVAHLPDDLEE